MQSVSSRIWTRVAVSISYDDNHYTMDTSKTSKPYIKFGIQLAGMLACHGINIFVMSTSHNPVFFKTAFTNLGNCPIFWWLEGWTDPLNFDLYILRIPGTSRVLDLPYLTLFLLLYSTWPLSLTSKTVFFCDKCEFRNELAKGSFKRLLT